jgi:hypothetical protein
MKILDHVSPSPMPPLILAMDAAVQRGTLFSLLTDEMVAAILQCSPATLETWRRTGKGPVFVRIGPKLIRYFLKDVFDFLLQIGARETADALFDPNADIAAIDRPGGGPLMRAPEMQAIFRIGSRTLRNWMQEEGGPPRVKDRRFLRFERAAVLQWMKANRWKSTTVRAID